MKQGWENIRLGEICEILDSKRKPITKINRISGEYPYYGATGIVDWVNDYLFDEKLILLGEDGAKWDSGDESAFIISGKTWVNNHAHVLRPHRNVIVDNWLVYYLNHQCLHSFITGLTVPKLNQGRMREIPIPIPPLDEQKRIVEKLDECFEAIDKARANVEKNLQNAKELFQSKLNEIFSQKSDGWVVKSLKAIGQIQTGTTPPTNDKSNYGNYIPFVKPAHFNPDGSINAGDCMLSESGLKKGRLFPSNSVLMVCIGATIGKTGFSEKPVSSNQQINCLTPTEEYNPKLFYYGLISPFVQKQVADIGKGAQATLPIINKSKWQELRINIPKEKTIQNSIVTQLDELKSKTLSLEINYKQELDALDELKKSILQKAFEGEL